jgi:nicotinamidase-related amidase
MSLHLLIVDAQRDFCDGPCAGSLAVPGAFDDLSRLAAMVRRLAPHIDAVHATLDAHHTVDIAHPVWWRNPAGESPAPFTIVSAAEVEAGTWTSRDPARRARSLAYVRQLEAQGNYPLCIWPPHCLIGSAGQTLHPELFQALCEWENLRLAQVDTVTKGSNPWTEHYSAIRAEVPDPADAGTRTNAALIEALAAADTVAVAGEALSHCVRATICDIAQALGDKCLNKLVFIVDASSSVPGFEKHGADFLADMEKRGMRLSTTLEFQG